MKESKATVDLNEDAVLVVKQGKIKRIPKPDSGFGEHVVTWQDGKIHAEKVSYTVK
ncbi:DUF3954 domain-containing protein [Virgibacillus salarius]|uniref:DUF3954 domain-containing protein n=1 Tax=Virgibacillus salarius TaxID=447199 RepID=UPI002493BE18|nr:DUF3954 domain-containing protein [Virgibacillus salarius]WBX81307.1 DUF3954 domain-containing protein [Virgibacillus salarius]